MPGRTTKFRRLLATIAIIYGVLCVFAFVFQRRLIYFPTKLPPIAAEQAAAQKGFSPWRDQTGQIIGWNLRANSPPTGSVLIVHGNAGCALDRGYLADPIHSTAKVDVYILEYPGYGARSGSPSQASILAAADEAFALLTNHPPIYIVSESLGAGAATHIVKEHGGLVAGLMLFVPYNNFVSVAQRSMPIFPVWLLLRDRYAPDRWIANYKGPVGMMLAGADKVIPNDLGRRLYDSCKGPKRLWVIQGAGHNDVSEQSREWWKDVFEFWRQNPPTN